MNIVRHLPKAAKALSIFLGDLGCSMKGQTIPDAIVQTAHRIEKGLTIQNPRRLWGWNKIEKLVNLLEKELAAPVPHHFALETGASVLKAYVDAKKRTGDQAETERALKLLERAPTVRDYLKTVSVAGGARHLHIQDVTLPEGLEWTRKLFSTRHSIRDFSDRPVPREALLQAVQLALLCPSACNRQPLKVYVLDGKCRQDLGCGNTYNADKFLVVTGEINAFTRAEYGDWIVSSTIFATYLVLALHALGIGSCMMKKELHLGSPYTDFLRKTCHIPRNEKIVLELAVGYYKDSFAVACSNRKDAKDVLVFPDAPAGDGKQDA